MIKSYLNCNIRTPDGILYTGEAKSVRIDTDNGVIEVHPNHANLVSTVTFSRIILQKDNAREYVMVRNGYLEFNTETNTLDGYFLDGEKGGKVKFESVDEYRQRVINDLRSKDDSRHKYSVRFLKKEATALEKMLSIEEKD